MRRVEVKRTWSEERVLPFPIKERPRLPLTGGRAGAGRVWAVKDGSEAERPLSRAVAELTTLHRVSLVDSWNFAWYT